jgi:hypothetical protein
MGKKDLVKCSVCQEYFSTATLSEHKRIKHNSQDSNTAEPRGKENKQDKCKEGKSGKGGKVGK